ncbi:phosphatidate cytidylyltransferase [Falsiroseomonas oryzae]|uniref:phosphatidate cytidylyltransferase n=1 Tax=Falsiroseomonas oryzae TaxID=2766473 RepID=UPI0022EB5DA6|nr:CDP-archaeol synthase [Roseomonas sp. MO-31]
MTGPAIPDAAPEAASAAAARAKRWGDLRKRALSAMVLGPAAVACIWLGAEAFTGMMALATALLAWEWVHMCGRRVRVLPGMAVPLAVLAAGVAAVQDNVRLALFVLACGFLVAWWFARSMAATLTQPALRLALGVLYIGLAGIALIELRHDTEAGRANVLFLFLVVWASDIGAYLAGRMLGGPKLWPAVSPNKTWSGAVGGLAAAILVGLAAALAFTPAASLLAVVAVAALLGVASQAGDLLESAIKRHFHVKDSSHLIPGHGGLLDRLDGVLAAAPVAALLSFQLGYGRVLWAWG